MNQLTAMPRDETKDLRKLLEKEQTWRPLARDRLNEKLQELIGNIADCLPAEAKNNVVGLAKTAKALGVPVVLTTSRDGPNGVIIPELTALFPGRRGHPPSRA